MEGEHTPETDLSRHHQVLEEGDKFESSFLSLDRLCFLALLRVHTDLLRNSWNALRLPSVGLVFQEEMASSFGATASSLDSVYHVREEG